MNWIIQQQVFPLCLCVCVLDCIIYTHTHTHTHRRETGKDVWWQLRRVTNILLEWLKRQQSRKILKGSSNFSHMQELVHTLHSLQLPLGTPLPSLAPSPPSSPSGLLLPYSCPSWRLGIIKLIKCITSNWCLAELLAARSLAFFVLYHP